MNAEKVRRLAAIVDEQLEEMAPNIDMAMLRQRVRKVAEAEGLLEDEWSPEAGRSQPCESNRD